MLMQLDGERFLSRQVTRQLGAGSPTEEYVLNLSNLRSPTTGAHKKPATRSTPPTLRGAIIARDWGDLGLR